MVRLNVISVCRVQRDIRRCEQAGRLAGGYLEVPVEAADVDAARVPPVVLQCGVVDDVYDGTDDGAGVQGDAVQQGFQPA